MNIAKALKRKNKLASELETLKARFRASNSLIEGNKRNYNTKTVYDEIIAKESELVNLKLSIAKANIGIVEKIYQIAELKGRVQMLKSTSTNEGTHNIGYSEKTSTYVVELNEIEINEMVLKLETEIEALQDAIDTYNHTTTI